MQLRPDTLVLPVDFLKHLQLIPRLGVAVSGGSDSMALLHLVTQAGEEAGANVHAATVDHGLRDGSAEEAGFVARACAALDVPHDTLHWTGWDGQGNLQAMAREARYRLLADWAMARDIPCVVLGHTADDLAETMVMRLARGAGVDGLTGMAAQMTQHGVRFLRPILGLRRADLQAYLTGIGADWCDDPSNDDSRFDRIRIRQAMESLEAVGLTPKALATVAENMQSARQALHADMRRQAKHCVTSDRGDLLIEDAAFGQLNPEQARRMIAACLRWISGAGYAPRREVQIKLMQAVRHRKHATASGCLIVPEDGGVRICREANAISDVRPGEGIWDHRWQVSGPHAAGQIIRALGEAGLRFCPDWRDAGLPRASLAASPAVWQGETLVSAPLAGNSNGWTARIVTDFHDWLVSH